MFTGAESVKGRALLANPSGDGGGGRRRAAVRLRVDRGHRRGVARPGRAESVVRAGRGAVPAGGAGRRFVEFGAPRRQSCWCGSRRRRSSPRTGWRVDGCFPVQCREGRIHCTINARKASSGIRPVGAGGGAVQQTGCVRVRCGSARRPARTRRGPRADDRAWPGSRRGRWAAGGSSASPGSAISWSSSASPVPGPNAMDSATARFSSTTGDGETSASCSYSQAMRSQSVSSKRRARAWQAAMAAWSTYGAGLAVDEGVGLLQRGQPAADQQLVPAAPVLVRQQDRLAAGADAGVGAGGLDLHQRHQAVHLGLVRGQPGQDSAQPQRILAQPGPHPVVAGGGRVALVEDQVDDFEHRGEPGRQLLALRHLEGHLGLGQASSSPARSVAPQSVPAPGRPGRSRRW